MCKERMTPPHWTLKKVMEGWGRVILKMTVTDKLIKNMNATSNQEQKNEDDKVTRREKNHRHL